MRLDLIKKPEGVWASFNEFCGTGDGVTKEFKIPIPASEARSVLVLRDFEMVAPAGRLIAKNEKDGTILSDEPNGYKLERRGGGLKVPTDDDLTPDQSGDELWIVFDQAPFFEVHVSVSGLGRKVGDAFCILPMSTLLQKKIQEKQPKIFRGPAKERDNVTQLDLQEAGRVSFQELVVGWTGITGGDDAPLPCNAETKGLFLDRKDAMFFGLFVSNRSSAIRAEGIQSQSKDSSD
jgi:hypothetical protein